MSDRVQNPCPICSKPSGPPSENRTYPFCSSRCKAVDLGKWLNEEYRIPSVEPEADPLAAEDEDQTLH